MMTTTTGDTRLVPTAVHRRPSSAAARARALGDRLLFAAEQTGSPQPQLWSTAGTAATTSALTALLLDLVLPAPGPAPDRRRRPRLLLDRAGQRPSLPRPLWRTDGTAAGTFPLLPEQRIDARPAALDGELFYLLDEPDATVVWKSDGTVAGTEPAFELPPGVRMPRYLTAVGDELYFVALSADGPKYGAATARPPECAG